MFEQDVLCRKVAHSLFSTVYVQIIFYIPVSHKVKTENVFEERQKYQCLKHGNTS